MDHYAVIGNPIAHSKSPAIHAAFAQQTGQAMQYDAFLVGVQEGEFVKAVQSFQAYGGKGLNITVPFKQAAWTLANQRSERAERAGAINTLCFDDKKQCIGENTDGIGLVHDLIQNNGCQIERKSVLILGAGGAVRGVLEPLLDTMPKQCVIANRTLSKAETLAELFADFGNITISTYEALQAQSYDLIINATSASLQGELPPLPNGLLTKGGWCYDMMYASTATPFMQWAKNQGAAHILDGLGMLVEQAAESFYLWRNVRPNTAPVIQQIREYLIVDTTQTSSQNRQSEIGGPKGLEPTRYGDWEKKGRCIDF
ncbi:shikimate dehydrogenase [Candidatus Parabeggiatoa sp. HSG14]|uniref:shikimate dehydrogenase n=1 Tax=Candidatus Parabeggiatoa sp. HSG14 TaxID=3055593 RepID=UPI0032E42441